MRQKSFASIILFLGVVVLVGSGYLAYQSFKKAQSTNFVDDSDVPDAPTNEDFQFDNTRQKDLYEIQYAIETYIIETGKYPTSTAELVPTYIKRIPVDPETKKNYILKFEGGTYTLSAILSDGSTYTVTSELH